MKNNILVVDDDTRLRILLGKFLEENGFTVELASNAELAKEAIEKNNSIFQLIIIDIMMPGENGFELTSYFKQNSKTKTIPIIILTARGDVNDRLIGLEAGAEDYLSKPFEPKELLLRINNILKRANGARVSEDSNKNKEEICCFGEFNFNFNDLRLKKNQDFIYLTEAETKILTILCKNIGTVVSREIIAKLTGDIDTRSIDVQINRIRRKIEDKSKQPYNLQTIRNQGYILHK